MEENNSGNFQRYFMLSQDNNRSLFLYTNFVDELMPKKGKQLPVGKIDFKAWQIWEISGRFLGGKPVCGTSCRVIMQIFAILGNHLHFI